MPVTAVTSEANLPSFKTLTPLSSQTEQAVVLDEYGIHLAQFSIAINRVLGAGISNENLVALVKLLAGMYALLKTSLLGPKQYAQLLQGIAAIEEDATIYVREWAQMSSVALQENLLELAGMCGSVVQRAYLTLFIIQSCPELQAKHVQLLPEVCKGVLHPLKGIFLQKKLLSVLQDISGNPDVFIESYSLSLKLFARWLQMGVRGEKQQRLLEREELFELAFCPLLRSINQVSTNHAFSTVFLPTILSELINTSDSQTQTLIFDSLYSCFRMELIVENLGAIIKSTGQFTTDFDIRARLEELFEAVLQHANFAAQDLSFFTSVWQEIQSLIKNRCEIDLKDSVSITTALVSLAFKTIPNAELSEPLDEVFSFLSKILLQSREETFPAASPVGAALVELFDYLLAKVADLSLFLQLAGKSGLLALGGRLAPSALRTSFLSLAAWISKQHLSQAAFYSLFGCFLQGDVMKMMDNSDESVSDQFQSIAVDLTAFVDSLLSLQLSQVEVEHLNGSIQSGQLICLFLFPKLVFAFPENFALKRKLLTTILSCTATALPPALFHEAEHIEWLQPEYPKTLAIQLNLQCAAQSTSPSESYEFYSEVLSILNAKISSEPIKLDILAGLIENLAAAGGRLEPADLSCLVDHLIMNANQLLRKRERCQFLLSTLESFVHDEARRGRLEESIALLLEGFTEERVDLSLKLLELEQGAKLDRVFKWLSQQPQVDQVRFYTVKLRYEAITEVEEIEDQEKESEQVELPSATTSLAASPVKSQFDELDQIISDDLKKLSVFESLPDSFNFN